MRLNQRQLDVANALARGATVREAARLHGVHEVTISRWRREPEFRQAVALLSASHLAGLDVRPMGARR